MDANSATNQPPIAPLCICRFIEPRKPSERSADFPAIGEDDMQYIGSDGDIHGQRLKPNG